MTYVPALMALFENTLFTETLTLSLFLVLF